MIRWLIRGLLFRTLLRRFWWAGLLLVGLNRLRGGDEPTTDSRRSARRYAHR